MKADPPDIVKRSFHFAVRIVRLSKALPNCAAGNVIVRQLIRAGSGVGANVEEAQAASTKKEFARRMEIAQSEARESLYWLRLIVESELLERSRLAELLKEADELVRILTAISRKYRGR